MTTASRINVNRRALLKSAAAGTAAALAAPMVARADSKSIKIGMSTILSGRVAQLGTSSRNAVMMEVEKINGAGGLAGRQIEMVIRDSKGQPQEAARLARELINTDGCEILIDAEASSGAFAVHEVARDLGMLCLHTNSETSSLTADPKLRLPNAFRTCRQGVHDSIAGGAYAANIAKAKNLSKWMTASPDYAYGRDTTAEYMTYVKHFKPDVEVVGESWPKLFQPDYTEVLTKILQTKPQVLYTCLWGGDITAFIDQGNIYAVFGQTETFAVNMADYTALTAVKNLPRGIHSGNRYIKTFPNTPENAVWGDAYRAKYNEYPTNWSWENATAIQFLAAAAKLANSADGAKLAEVLKGLTIASPFGADGKLTLRADDHTLVGYAIGWGTTLPNEPYIADMVPGDWNQIFPLEGEWKKSKNFT
jgi:branched-chain amino acid transport system substrate-binding protein